MKRPLRLQILLPTAGLLLAAVCINAVFAAYLASEKVTRDAAEQLENLGQVLTETSFPRSSAILEKLRQMTRAESVIWDRREAGVTTSTLLEPARGELAQRLPEYLERDQVSQLTINLAGQGYRMSRIDALGTHGPGARPPEVLFVLLPAQALAADRWRAVFPAVAVGLLSLCGLIPIMLQVAGRLGRRLANVQLQVAAVAEGNYDSTVDDGPQDDEIHAVVAAVNRMTLRIRDLQQRIEQSERTRLLGQVAGGLAHQLRNAITGARFAAQLHQRRCPAQADESLGMVLKQLALTEHQLRGLLSLGPRQASQRVRFDARQILTEVRELIALGAEHQSVRVDSAVPDTALMVTGDRVAIQAAVLNLALNAVEAAGRGGQVLLQCDCRPLLYTANGAASGTANGAASRSGGTRLTQQGVAEAPSQDLSGTVGPDLSRRDVSSTGDAVDSAFDQESPPSEVVWTVRDSGPGPTVAAADRMFDPFVTTKPEGVGLGLALAKQVSVDHHGVLTWSRCAGWTEFRLSIPRTLAARSVSELEEISV